MSFMVNDALAMIQKLILGIETRKNSGKRRRSFQKHRLKINLPRSRLHHPELPPRKNWLSSAIS
jgi:hypothetical protein